FPTSQDAVHQRRLADVRTAHYRNDRRRGAELLEVGGVFGFACLPIAFIGPGAVFGAHRTAPLWSWTSSRRCAITWSAVRSPVSTTRASSAARKGDIARLESRWSRRMTSA